MIFARLEAACANAVERAFALAFPTALEPVQIARKLVAAFESGASAASRTGRRFVVRVSPADFARLGAERAYYERQWSAMLARLGERARTPQRTPHVSVEADRALAGGTVAIAVQALPEPLGLRLCVRKGVPPGASVALEQRVVAGRDAQCDLVLLDARVSRRHFEIVPEGARLRFADLGSSNGTLVNGRRLERGELGLGDVLVAGDTELAIEPADE